MRIKSQISYLISWDTWNSHIFFDLNMSHEIKLLHDWSFKFVHCRTYNNQYIIYPYDILYANTFHKWEIVEEIVANGTSGCKSQAKIIAKLKISFLIYFYLFSKSLWTLLNNNATIHQGPKAEDPQTKLRNQHGSQ